MALQHAMTIEETTYPEAYTRALFIRVDKMSGYVFVNTYANKQAREDNELPIYQMEYRTERTLFNGDVFQLAYDYLKTLPEFAGAVDC